MPPTLQAECSEDAAASSDVARVAEHAEPNLTCTMLRTAEAPEFEHVCTWAGEACSGRWGQRGDRVR